MPDSDETCAAVSAVACRLLAGTQMLATAESCTGGWIAKALTDQAGSSAWFAGGIVSYSNASKMRLLGVKAATLENHGAVSEATVREMAAGALQRFDAHYAIAVSGVAGPDGGTQAKPVGTVWIAWGGPRGIRARRLVFKGDREAVRRQAVQVALSGLFEE